MLLGSARPPLAIVVVGPVRFRKDVWPLIVATSYVEPKATFVRMSAQRAPRW